MKEYNSQKMSADLAESAISLMLSFGWEIITPKEFYENITEENRIYIDAFEVPCKNGYYEIYFSRDKDDPHFAEFAKYQKELFKLAEQLHDPKKPNRPDGGLIFLGIIFPVIGIGLIIAAIVGRVKYSKKLKEQKVINDKMTEICNKAAELLKDKADPYGGVEKYLQIQADKIRSMAIKRD